MGIWEVSAADCGLSLKAVAALNALLNGVSRKLLGGRGHDYALRIFRSAVVGQKVSFQHELCPYRYTARISRDMREFRHYVRKKVPLEPWVHFVKTIVTDGDTVFDIGAHVGRQTIHFSHLCGDDGLVYAFEPERSNYELLCENIAQNGITNCVPLSVALSNEQGSAMLHLNPYSGEGHSVIASGHSWSGEEHEQYMVECNILDAFCSANGIERIKLVKIDVEGAHFLVLQGATGMLMSGRIDVVICEAGINTYAISGRTDQELFAFMSDLGYVPHLVVGDELVEVASSQQYPRLVDFVFVNSRRVELLPV